MKKIIIYLATILFPLIVLFFLVSFKLPTFKNEPPAVQQNVVIIFMDDMGYGDLLHISL